MATPFSNSSMQSVFSIFPKVVKNFLTDSSDSYLNSSFRLFLLRYRNAIHLIPHELPDETFSGVRSANLLAPF